MFRYSVLIRAKNGVDVLPETLSRLRQQSLPPSEIIVVDSGSTDGTLDLARSAGARIVTYQTDGKFNYSRALNLGFEAAVEPHVLVVSSHVGLGFRDTVEHLATALQDPAVHAAYCPLGGSSEFRTGMVPVFQRIDSAAFNGMNGLSNCCALYRREAWVRRPFDEKIPTAEDQLWAMQALTQEGGVTVRLASHPVWYRNPNASPSKDANEHFVIHYHVLPRATLLKRTLKMILCLPLWMVRRQWRTFRVSSLVALRLLKALVVGVKPVA